MSHIGTGSGRSVADQSGTPRLLHKITVSTTGAVTALNGTTLEDHGFVRTAGQQILLQGTVDFRFEVRTDGEASTHVTQADGEFPGVLVQANHPGWFLYLNRKDVALDLIAVDSTGVVSVYLIQI